MDIFASCSVLCDQYNLPLLQTGMSTSPPYLVLIILHRKISIVCYMTAFYVILNFTFLYIMLCIDKFLDYLRNSIY